MINMWYQFSGADLFFGKRRIFVFIFSRLMEWGQQQLICVCILMIDNSALKASEPHHNKADLFVLSQFTAVLKQSQNYLNYSTGQQLQKRGLSIDSECIYVIYHETVKPEIQFQDLFLGLWHVTDFLNNSEDWVLPSGQLWALFLSSFTEFKHKVAKINVSFYLVQF